MKEAELRKRTTCDVCLEKITKSGLPIFHKVTVETYDLNAQAISAQQGLTMQLGGSAQLASVMGTNEDMADKIDTRDFTICQTCYSDKRISLPLIFEE